MKIGLSLLYLSFAVASVLAQTPAVPSSNAGTPNPNPGSTGSAPMTSVLPDLDRLQTAASQVAIDLGHMRIEKWKADGQSKQQAQANAESVQRNLTSALPGLIENVRSAPQDLNANFKLYRNLNALYDVFGSLTESAGAFGPKSDYEALAQQLGVIDSVRRDLADALERLTSFTQYELNQLRSQIRAQQQAAAAAAAVAPPKKIMVDDTEPPKKSANKKKKGATSSSGSNSNAPGTNSSNNSGNPPKS